MLELRVMVKYLTPLSTIFQLYRGGNRSIWTKTTNLSQVTNKFHHTTLVVIGTDCKVSCKTTRSRPRRFFGIKTHPHNEVWWIWRDTTEVLKNGDNSYSSNNDYHERQYANYWHFSPQVFILLTKFSLFRYNHKFASARCAGWINWPLRWNVT